MPRRRPFFIGLLAALVLTVGLAAGLFLASHAGRAFDSAFVPILLITAGIGVVLLLVRQTRTLGLGIICGAVASFLVQVGALITMLFVGGGS